jgi:hypothetical protein
MRIAKGTRRVTALVFPNDLQEAEYSELPRAHGTVHSGVGYSAPVVVPAQQRRCWIQAKRSPSSSGLERFRLRMR